VAQCLAQGFQDYPFRHSKEGQLMAWSLLKERLIASFYQRIRQEMVDPAYRLYLIINAHHLEVGIWLDGKFIVLTSYPMQDS
jgi:hypothetical protein